MENHKLMLPRYCNNLNSLNFKLALKTPQQDFSELILHNVAKATRINLKIISKLPGINNDRFDWYCVEISGTFDDLWLALTCWRELGVQKYIAISSQPLLK